METKDGLDYCDIVFNEKRCIGVSTRHDNKGFKFPFTTTSRLERMKNGTIWIRDCSYDDRYAVRKLVLKKTMQTTTTTTTGERTKS